VTRAFLGLGSNLGDRIGTLQRAVDLLSEHGVRTIASSRVWETEPVGGPAGQDDFLNAVILVGCDLDPLGVLSAANRVEDALGRVRDVRWGPRTIDIDVLLVDGVSRDDPELTIPHPRLLQRAFALLPLLELDPDPLLPDGRRVVDAASVSGIAWPLLPPFTVPA
jgi:2-amino-4-hydroxy-6-hydroxymethyldihydropteridine diphosphokinase